MKAAIYCRVSSVQQVDNYSLELQEQACREYCQQHGFEAARVYVERGESAKTADRTEFQKMLGDLRGSDFDVVVVYSLSRFARNRLDHAVIRSHLQGLGVVLRSVTEPIDEGATGQLLEGVMSAFHEFDNRLRADRSSSGMRAALEAGRWTWKAPVGYVMKDGLLEVDPERAPLVREAFDLVAGGESLSDVRRYLRQAHGWTPASTVFHSMLRRELYCGWIDVPRMGVRTLGVHRPLISEETFARAQQALGERPGRKNSATSPDFPLRRFVSCARCDRPLTGGWSRGRGGRYRYYRCTTKACIGSVAGEVLEGAFLDLLRRATPDPRYVRILCRIMVEMWEGEIQAARDRRRIVERRIANIEAKRKRLVSAYLYEESIDRETYEAEKASLDSERLAARLELSGNQERELDVEAAMELAEVLVVRVDKRWKQLSVEGRQHLQRFVFPDGLRFDGAEFLNPRTHHLFNGLEPDQFKKRRMVAPTVATLNPREFVSGLLRLRDRIAA